MTISEGNNIHKNIFENEDVFVFPASYGQKRMWFLDQFEPGSPYYNIPVAFKIKGKFNNELFQKTIDLIVERHESIRTTFADIKGKPHQIIHPDFKIKITSIELNENDLPKIEKRIKEIAVAEARAPFNLSTGPLFRVTVVKISDQENAVFVTMHHIISDGWSMGILVGEITNIYAAFLDGKEPELPSLEIQYADFSEWQNEYLSGDVLDEQIKYWTNQLGDSNSLLELPTDRPRQEVYTNNGSSLEKQIDAKTIEALQNISNSENATLFMTLVAAFNIILYRYSGQNDINIGTPIANRTDKDMEKIIGLFINTLVLRTNLSGNPTFRELLRRVRKTNLEAFDHQDLPFEMLVDAIQPERNMSYAPLFQVMLILQNNPVKAAKLPEFEVSMINVDMGTATSDITYSISTGRDGATCSIEYNTDLFDESTMEQMFSDFNTLLKSVADDPDSKISHYDIVDKHTKDIILNKFGYRKIDFPVYQTIHSLFERWVEKVPEQIAVVDAVNQISYNELNRKANQLAHYLLSVNNLDRNIPIGISQDKTVNLLVSVLGVLKAGYAYLPLDPSYPEERLKFMVEDSGITLVISDKNNFNIFNNYKNEIIVIDEFKELQSFPDQNPAIQISKNDLAYIIYTSGSTGKAKGTMLQHGSLINIYLGWEKDYELLENAKNHLQMASFSFDVFGGDWTRALCSGGKLVLVNREQLLDAEYLYKVINKENIEIAEFVPAVLRNLIEYLDENSFNLSTFKVLIAGSDIWYVKEYNEFKKYCNNNVRLINSFGLTETAIDSTFFEDNDLSLPEERLVPIGKPFPNINIYILDPFLNIVPVGVKGELFIGGISLARGYYKNPVLTAERFIPNPYSSVKGERIYKTGDVARYLKDGNIEFLGRSDQQIKLRGFRIELGEIENAISEHSAIKDSIVIVREDTKGDKRLVAYFTSKENIEIDKNELRNFVSGRVPDYMVPSALVKLDKFPLTPNGKVDRKSLPIPDQDEIQKSLENDFVAPRNNFEEKIANIWSDILNIEKIGVLHNFFVLGGHSLLATQVVSRIKSEFKINLPLRLLFEKPTVEEIAQEVERLLSTSAIVVQKEIKPRIINENIPLSFAQERLWFLDQLEPDSPFYNIPESYRIKGNINLELLEKSFNIIIERHEILRTYFVSVDGSPYQIIKDSYDLEIPILDLSNLSDNDKQKAANEHISKETKTPISIDKLPLFRIKILKLDKDDFIFLMTIHHIISDDWSTKVIVQELGVIYESLSRGITPSIPQLKIQYADYSIWQREWLKDEILKSHIKYWKDKLDDLPPLLELPIDKPRPKAQTFNGDFTSFEFDSGIKSKLQIISKQEDATVFMILLAAFKILLSKLSGQKDICVGTPNANRNREEIEPLIGFFVNTLALRTNLDDNPTFSEFLARIKDTTLGAYSHQDLPFEYIVDAVNPERNMSHSPIFQVMFVYQKVDGQGETDNSQSKIKISSIETHSRTSKFDLTLFMVDSNESIGGAFEYNTDLFNKNTIDEFISYFKKILSDLLSQANLPIDSVSLIDKAKQISLLDQINKNDSIPLLNNLLPKYLHEVEKQYSNKIAVVSNGKEFTYNDLSYQSNKLSNLIANYGLGNENIIAICLPRSFNLILSLFGVLKAGAAYLPIDPQYPKERIDYILSDANVNLVITDNSYLSLFENKSVNVLNIDNKDLLTNEKLDKELNINIDENNLAYVIYTSGSTGKPKGTLLTQKGLRNYLSWANYAYPFKQNNGSLVHSSISFDATITSIFPPLLNGKKLIMMEDNSDLDGLTKTIKENDKFSTIKITPAHLELLSDLLTKSDLEDVTDAMVIGGENLTANQIENWQQYSSSTLLYNEYGPTETVVGCIVYEASKYKGYGSVPVGKVIPNLSVYILDDNLTQLPKGITGELYIGGISLARGYINKPELTANKFIPNPYATSPGERIYKTGDLVKIQKDGNIIFIGRTDDQVKVRGYRIELGEIENHLFNLEEIKEAVVDVKEFGEGDKRIIAYVVTDSDKINQKNIIDSLKIDLPEYMLPSHIVFLESIPLTINGKVDRNKLPLPSNDVRDNKIVYVEPKTKTEKTLNIIWQEVLKLNKIRISDNFFELGGHSLLVTKLVVRIEQNFGIVIPIKDIFQYPTIAELSEKIDSGNYSAVKNELPKIERLGKKEDIPLSFTQRRLWFLDKLDPGQSIYNMPMAVIVKGKLDVEIINKCIDYLAERHESLRTNFTEKDGIPTQFIREHHNIQVDVEDYSNLSVKEQNEIIQKIKFEEATKSFDLENDSLIRFRIVKLSEEKFVISFTMHHIISDGWSVNILLNEFVKSYIALLDNNNPNLPQLKVQYSDFAIWQQKNIAGEVLNKEIEYWTNKLADQPANLELPLDKPRPVVKTFNGSHISFTIEKKSLNKLKEFIELNKLTPFMFLMGSFQILLAKLSGQTDISVGTPVANRQLSETENLIGFFANTLVIRNIADGVLSLKEYFEQVKKSALEAYENQDAPFEKLVEILQPERNLSHTPLFQIMFVLQTSDSDLELNSTFNLEALESDSTSTQYDLTLSMNVSENSWSGTFEYNTDLFEGNTIKSFIDSFTFILNEITDKSKKKIYDLEFLTETEKERILKLSSPQTRDVESKNVIEAFTNIANNNKNRIACEDSDKNISYEQLDIESNKICNYLLSEKLKKEDVVCVMMNNNVDLISWMMGIMKAGCCYLPIDPTYPEDRINYIISDSKAKAIVLYEHQLAQINDANEILKININEISNRIKNYSTAYNFSEIDKNNLAYSIYTSGTTGKPKGVLLRHEGLINLVENQIKDFHVTPESRVLQFASISFDASISEIFMGLLSGATLVLTNRDNLKNAIDVQNILINKNITVVTLPPSLLQVIDSSLPYQIKTLVSAGEKLDIDLVDKWKNIEHVVNAFGPTETTVGVSSFEISNINRQWSSVPLGQAIKNVGLFILDKNLNLVSEGTIGEICITGISLARGYIGKPDLTAEKFVPAPYSKVEGARIYRTGDLGKLNKDGLIEYFGRVDEQVKVRGFRVELSEIESLLNSNKEIERSVVLVKGKGENARLVSFVKMDMGYSFNSDSIKKYLSNILPEYMIPSLIIEINEIPLTNNGKIDRKKLTGQIDSENISKIKYVAPSNEIEQKLVEIWQELLGISKIGIYDNFFELGGHSLLITQLLSRINSEFEIELNIKDLFESVNIKVQAFQIQLNRNLGAKEKQKIIKVERPDHIPLSFAQQRLWVLDRIENEHAVYNVPTALKLIGNINKKNIEESLRILVNRHESLRTNFYDIDNVPYQLIHDTTNVKFNLNFRDLSNLTKESAIIEAAQVLHKEAVYVFDLEEDSLFRFTLIKVSTNEHIISFTFHHIITDGWSINLLLKEFTEIYSSLEKGTKYLLPELNLQYADYAVWQRSYLEGKILDTQINYWSYKLKEIPPVLNLPIDKPRPQIKTFSGDRIELNLPQSVKDSVNQFASKEGATVFMVLLSVFKILLSKYSGQKDICIGTPIANRTQLETEQIVGFFANTLVLRTLLQGDPDFEEILQRVKQTSLEAYANQDVPFEKLVEMIQPERDLSHSPLFQVMFVMQNNPKPKSTAGKVTIEAIDNKFDLTQYELTLSAEESIDGITLWLEYNTDLFEKSTIQKMLERYAKLLNELIQKPSIKLSRIELPKNIEEIDFIEQNLKGNIVDHKESNIIELFEEIAAKRPEELSVIDDTKELTYTELNNRANQIANMLLDQNVKREEVIAVMLPKTVDTIAIIIGIMKSGCTYLPIDNSYPEERQNYILENSGAKIIITDTPEFNAEDIVVINYKNSINNFPNTNTNFPIVEESLAYIIYTSGSTGQPKGTMLTHKGLLNLVKNQIKDFGIDNSNILQFASLSFDASISEIFISLASGSRLFLYNNKIHSDKKELIQTINKFNISKVTLPPSLLAVLETKEFENVKTIVSAGEILPVDVAEKYRKKVNLINAYGPTESTVGVVNYKIEPSITLLKNVPIGNPYDNVEIYLLDEGLNIVPQGVTGEIYIAGVQLARGYVNNPSKTAEVFLPNPFSGNGERIYKTGDLGKLDPSGRLEYIGRIDSQVKLRGFRIELGEIENNLRKISGIKNAVVDVKEKSNNKILVGYLIEEEGKNIDLDYVKKILRSSLPEYMIPNIFIKIDEIPKNISGKIDRKKLPDIDNIQTIESTEFILPSNKTEKKLLKIWKQLLGLEKISVNDNFFEIGGHSLLAIQLIGKISDEFNVDLEMVQLFQEPTIVNLSKEIIKQESRSEDTSKVIVKFNEVEGTNPIFFIHPSGGSVHWYTFLSREFNDKQSFYGIQALGINGKVEPQTTIEEMAATYIRAIKEVKPKGPYIIGSWSMGVIIAYEIANQLSKKGEIVKPLIILDQGPILPNEEAEDTAEFLSRMFMGRIEFDLDKLRKLSYDDQLKTVLKKAKKERQFPKFITFKRFKTYVKILKIQQDAWRNYKIPKYSGDLTLITAKDSNYDYYDTKEFGWEKFVRGKINIYSTEGEHNTMLHNPRVKQLAQLIKTILK